MRVNRGKTMNQTARVGGEEQDSEGDKKVKIKQTWKVGYG